VVVLLGDDDVDVAQPQGRERLFGLPALTRLSSVYVGTGGADQNLFAWSLVWWPHALRSGQNPFHADVLWAPDGVNLAWVTAVPGPSLLVSPLTAVFGPVASLNVLLLAAPALAGWAAYLACRQVTGTFWPSVAGGYMFGFSTYLVAQRTSGRSPDWPYPKGVVNKAAKMKLIYEAVADAAQRGEPIAAFYARVHGGAPFIVADDGDVTVLKGHRPNGPSLGSQESQTGQGAIATGWEDGSPIKSDDFRDGEPARFVSIFETNVDRFLNNGPGAQAWRAQIQGRINADSNKHLWLGAEQTPAARRHADLNYLGEGAVTVNGRAVPAGDLKVAVSPDAFLVIADEADLPGVDQLVEDIRRHSNYRPGQDVVLYVCRAGTRSQEPGAFDGASIAKKVGDRLGARVHAVDGTIELGETSGLGEGARTVVELPGLPLEELLLLLPASGGLLVARGWIMLRLRR
jgi:uncharacterized membrane protein